MLALGYIEGNNFVFAERFADGQYEHLRELAAELVRLNVDVILASSTPVAIAASRATTIIPVIFDNVSDPVLIGLADSLGHPGRNCTGISNFSGDLSPKRLQLLKQMVPGLTRVALLRNPTNPMAQRALPGLLEVAEKLGLHALPFNASSPQEVESAFRSMAQQSVQAVNIQADAFLYDRRQVIAELALKYRLPSICPFAEFVEIGGLMSYGADNLADATLVAAFVDKIFRGAKPVDLPIQQPTRVDLIINRKTAGALQLTIPRDLLIQALKVIG